MPVRIALPAAIAMAAGLAGPAAAGDSQFDIAFGAAVASDYISRGITQTEHKAAVQGYVEADYGIAYASVWASNVSFDGDGDVEVDLAVGIRPEFDAFAFDIGYVHYLYADNLGPAYGEIFLLAEVSPTDALTLGADLYYAPDYAQGGGSAFYAEAKAEVALPWNFGVSGGLGYQTFDAVLGLTNYLSWNAGVFWTWDDTVTVDVRYSDTDLTPAECTGFAAANGCDARVMVSLAVDTSVSALTGGE